VQRTIIQQYLVAWVELVGVEAHINPMPIIITFLAAIVLGQRFKVLVLLPASIIAVVATIGAGLVEELNGWSIAREVLSVLTAVQVGYLMGTATQHFTAAARPGPYRRPDLHRAH
jgi:hypothetical protein